jgi:hypothetical protein
VSVYHKHHILARMALEEVVDDLDSDERLAFASRQVDDVVCGEALAHRLYLVVSQHQYALNLLAQRLLPLLRFHLVL